MDKPLERILLVESDPEIITVIARQALLPLGYKVALAKTAAAAIRDAGRLHPDLVVAGLNLAGLSGKDLLVALSSQGLQIPVIILSMKGAKLDLLQAFRLGAADFILWPACEAEIVAAVERVLALRRPQREHEQLARQLAAANEVLQQRGRELAALFAIGKAVTSGTEPAALLEKIIAAATYLGEADTGCLLLRRDGSKVFLLSAQHNLPTPAAGEIGRPWEDGLGPLVALSGESLSIQGEPMRRFLMLYRLGRSALVVPIKMKREVFGLITLLRKACRPFSPDSQALVEAVADIASIALINMRLFRALNERGRVAAGRE